MVVMYVVFLTELKRKKNNKITYLKSTMGFSRKVMRTVLACGNSGTSSISMRSMP